MTKLDSVLKNRYHFANKGSYNQSYGFSSSHVTDVRVGPERRLSDEELMLLNCGAGEVRESLGPQEDQTSQS